MPSNKFLKDVVEVLTEENKNYKEENKLLQEMLVEIGLADQFKELLINPIKLIDAVEELKEELEQYQMSHPCDLNCENCGLTITEDDIEISLSCGCLICESCQDEANLPDLKKDIHFYKCFVNTVDPKCKMMNYMEKKDVDEYTDDEELREYLYEEFNLPDQGEWTRDGSSEEEDE